MKSARYVARRCTGCTASSCARTAATAVTVPIREIVRRVASLRLVISEIATTISLITISPPHGNTNEPYRTLSLLTDVAFREDALGGGEGGVGRRHAAVDGALEQDFFDLILGQTVSQRSADVQSQLVEMA